LTCHNVGESSLCRSAEVQQMLRRRHAVEGMERRKLECE